MKKVWKGLKIKEKLEQPSGNAAFSSTIRGERYGPRSRGGGAQAIREKVISGPSVLPTTSADLNDYEEFRQVWIEELGYPAEEFMSRDEFMKPRIREEAPRSETAELLAMAKQDMHRFGEVEVLGLPTPTYAELIELASHEPTDVEVAAILEPLKVRLITKGNDLRYWVSGTLQRAMHGHLKRMPQFDLTGTPVTEFHILQLLDRERRLGHNFPYFVSGDYTAATDGQNFHSTRHAFEQVLEEVQERQHLSDKQKDVFRSVIYHQKIHYPDSLAQMGGLEPVMQTNGQLMGSVLSFPILCAVNLVCYWRALNIYRANHNLPEVKNVKALPVLVNGDDILFRADDELYRLWNLEIQIAGYELSIGKNYIHPNIFTINSVCFNYHVKILNGVNHDIVRIIPFFNIGLLTGQSKITGRASLTAQPIWDHHNTVVSGALDQIRAHRRFLHYHSQLVRTVSRDGEFNLFLPHARGGCGFNVPNGWTLLDSPLSTLANSAPENPYITHKQRQLATFAKLLTKEQLSKGKKPKNLISVTKEGQVNTGRLERVIHHELVTIPFGPLEENTRLYTPEFLPSELITQFDDTESELKYALPSASLMRRFAKENCAPMLSRNIRWYGTEGVRRLAVQTKSSAEGLLQIIEQPPQPTYFPTPMGRIH
jgi:hypothetical protein